MEKKNTLVRSSIIVMLCTLIMAMSQPIVGIGSGAGGKGTKSRKFFKSENNLIGSISKGWSLAALQSGSQPSGIVLSNTGTSTISWVFDTDSWRENFGSTGHTGDDDYAEDWSRGLGQTEGHTVYAAISGIVAKAYDSGSGYGNTVVIYDSQTGFAVRYAHLQSGCVAEGQAVTAGVTPIGKVGHSGGDFASHLHIVLYRNVTGTSGRPISFISDGGTSEYSAPFNFTAGRVEPCKEGTSECYLPNGSAPIHPNGSLIKLRNEQVIYVLRNGQRLPIPSANRLWELYGPGRGFDFRDVITVSAQEMSRYSIGPIVNDPLPNNNPYEPNGRLIKQRNGSEISIVTGFRVRRPFASEKAFLGLGYLYCNVATVDNYFEYEAGPSVEEVDFGGAADEIAPNLTIDSHSNGQTVTSNNVTLTGTATDGGRGESGIVSVTINGVRASGDTATEGGTAFWSKSVPINPGANSFTVSATDGSPGANVISQTITINLQNQQGSTPSFSSLVSASPTSPTPGQATSITTRVTATSSATGVIVDREIFDSTGNKVSQLISERQDFGAGQTLEYRQDWLPPSSGTYRVKVGVFQGNWTLISWNDDALTINVGASPASVDISVWWPTSSQTVSGTQPFKARVEGRALSTYQMTWLVDGGQENPMWDSMEGGDHKEALVDLSGWTWRGQNPYGPYTVTFRARDLGGNLLGEKSVTIYTVP